jgi:WD40 repeat protein/tRNA A-37 threonylcarbamoyl transferase component Bud32
VPPELGRRIEAVCRRFEAAWRTGQAPCLEDYVGGWEGPERAALLRELVPLDADYRAARGEAPTPTQYLARFPDLDPSCLEDCPAAQPSPATVALAPGDTQTLPVALEVPRQVGDYELLEEIDRGAMGVVYRARQVSLNRLVALKMIRSGHFASAAEVQRFRIEAEIIAQLDHPNIVPIYEVGEIASQPCYSMKLIEGNSLRQDVPSYMENPRAAATLLAQVARAVGHAHERGILHRDLKPSNILLDAHKQPHVADFGLARRVGGDGLTASGAIVGTPEYMAPEQARSEKVLTTAVDVYSLGAVLYTLLSRRPPFKGKDPVETLRKVAEGSPCPPHTLNPRVDRDLEIICLKCLDVEPGGRYPSAQALAEELDRWLAGEPIQARPVGRTARLWRWSRRNPVLALLSSAAAVLLVMTAVIASVGYGLTSAALQDARTAWKETEDEKDRANQRTEEVRQERDRINGLLYLASMPQAQRAWEAGDLLRARHLLGQHQPRPGWIDPRAWEWYYLRARIEGELMSLRGHSAVNAIAFTPAGRRLATADRGGTIKVWDVANGQEVATLHAGDKGVYALAWAPDGKRLATAEGDETVKVWDVAASKVLVSLPAGVPAEAICAVPAWSPDGKRLATGGKDGAIRVWEVADGKEVLLVRAGGVRDLAWSPDGKRLASFGDGGVKLWDAATGEEAFTFWEVQGTTVRAPLASIAHVSGLAWSKDGKQVIFTLAAGKGLIKAWDSGTGVEAYNLIMQRHSPSPSRGWPSWRLLQLAWGPDGTRLASLSFSVEDLVQLWDTASGEEVLTLSGHESVSGGPPSAPGPPPQLAWSPDGKRLARRSGAGDIRVWEPSQVRRVVRSLPIEVEDALAWSPDGRHLLGPGPQGAIRFWDARSGEMTRTLGADASPLCAAAWSPDGRRLAVASRAGVVEVWDVARRKKSLSFQGYSTAVTTLSWSPDSLKLAAAGEDHTVRVWDLATSRLLFHGSVLEAGASPQDFSDTVSLVWSAGSRWLSGVQLPLWSPDGRRLATLPVKVWDADTGRVTLDLPRPYYGLAAWPGGVQLPLWSPDGRRLATLTGNGAIEVWDPGSGRKVLTVKAAAALFTWSADSRRLAAACQDGRARTWDAAAGCEVSGQELPGDTERPAASAWSPDGARLALANGQGVIQVWNRSTGKVEATFQVQEGSALSLAWSPDGQRLASVSSRPLAQPTVPGQPPRLPSGLSTRETVQVWSLARGKEVFHLADLQRHPQLAGADWLSWSPDSAWLAGALAEGAVQVWDAATGAAAFRLQGLSLPQAAGNPRSQGKTLNDSLRWGPGGRLAALETSGAVSVREVPGGKEVFAAGPRQPAVPTAPEPLAQVVASPDGRWLASSSTRGTVKVWQAATGLEALTLQEPPSPPAAFAWSPDGKRLAWRTAAGKVQVWDAGGKSPLVLRARSDDAMRISAVLAWSPDGRRLASSGPDALQAWDAATGAEILSAAHAGAGEMPLLSWSPDASRLAAVLNRPDAGQGVREEVKVWDTATGKEVFARHRGAGANHPYARIGVLVWSPDGHRLAASRNDGQINVWEAAAGKEVLDRRARGQGLGLLPALAWHPDSRRLALVVAEDVIEVRDVIEGKEVLTLGKQAGPIRVVTWSPDGKALAVAGGNPHRFDVPAEVKVYAADGKELGGKGLSGPVEELAWSPDGKHLAAACQGKGEFMVWEALTGKVVINVPAAGGFRLSWAPDGRSLVASGPQQARVWDVAGGKEGPPLPVSGGFFGSVRKQTVAWSPDSRRLALDGADGTLKVWDARERREVLSLGQAGVPGAFVLAFSPDGKRLAGAAKVAGMITVWDVGTGDVLLTLPGHAGEVRALAWNADGKRLASAGEDARVKVWDLAGARELMSFDYVFSHTPNTIPGPRRGAGMLAWSPDGSRLVMAGTEELIRVWDTSGGDTMTLYGHTGVVVSVAWSPDGRRLASASRDGTVKLWDAATAQEVFSLGPPAHALEEQAPALSWSPDGWKLALNWNRGITIWDARPDK